MHVGANQGIFGIYPWNYGLAPVVRHTASARFRFACATSLLLSLVAPGAGQAQQASQPGFVPRRNRLSLEP